ncbi:MAG: hypothetical protein WC222_01925 [Parachlamydiales bacterium]|jgi:hypothetical protein
MALGFTTSTSTTNSSAQAILNLEIPLRLIQIQNQVDSASKKSEKIGTKIPL